MEDLALAVLHNLQVEEVAGCRKVEVEACDKAVKLAYRGCLTDSTSGGRGWRWRNPVATCICRWKPQWLLLPEDVGGDWQRLQMEQCFSNV